jgi:hypothetical protein
MNLKENLEKLQCAKLQAEKQNLVEQFELLKKINVNNFLSESPMSAQMGSFSGQQSPMMSQQRTSPQQMRSKRGGKSAMPMMGPEEIPLAPGQDPRTGFTVQAQYGIPDPEMATIKQNGVEAYKKAEQGQNPLNQQYNLAMGQQGFALTPDWAQAQQYYMDQYYDDPNVPGRQTADKPSWQNLQTALSNYFGSQVNQLIRKQRMLG